MNDRELLELAARAAGMELKWGEVHILGDTKIDCSDLAEADGLPWDPLTDDGDALRLAVKLDIMVNPSEVEVHACVNVLGGLIVVPFGTDRYAATRRAIVRAAAKVGESA